MQIEKTREYNPKEQETSYYIHQKNDSTVSQVKLKLLEIIETLSSPKKELTFDEELNEKFLNLDFGSEFDIDAAKIGISDAAFFINLLNQEKLIDYSIKEDNLSLTLNDRKINATSSLLNMLKTSYDSQKAIRLDFDENVTVILKLDKEGKIQAHFIPGTSEVEKYLKNNIPILKQTFDEEEINYSYLGYSSKNKNSNNSQKKSKKEQ